MAKKTNATGRAKMTRQLLQALRDQHDTESAIAEALDVDQGYITRIRQGTRPISYELAMKIADDLRMDRAEVAQALQVKPRVATIATKTLMKANKRPKPDEVMKARERAGLTQAQAAYLVGLRSKSRWSEYETGQRMISHQTWRLFRLLVRQEELPPFPPTWAMPTPIEEKKKISKAA